MMNRANHWLFMREIPKSKGKAVCNNFANLSYALISALCALWAKWLVLRYFPRVPTLFLFLLLFLFLRCISNYWTKLRFPCSTKIHLNAHIVHFERTFVVVSSEDTRWVIIVDKFRVVPLIPLYKYILLYFSWSRKLFQKNWVLDVTRAGTFPGKLSCRNGKRRNGLRKPPTLLDPPNGFLLSKVE